MGSLRQTPLPRLLIGLQRDRFTGTLELRVAGKQRRFDWRAGAPIGITSNAPLETLCGRLVQRGQLRAEDAKRVAERAKLPGSSRELGALAALKLVAPKTLLVALGELLRSALIACFRDPDGCFAMEPIAPAESAPALPLDLAEVAYAGIVAHWRPEQVLEAFADRFTTYPSPAEGFAAARAVLPNDGSVAALVEKLDGRSSVYAALQASPSLAAYAALYVLDLQQGLVFHAEPASAGASGERPQEIEIVLAEAAEGAADAALRSERSAHAADIEDASALALRDQVLRLHQQLRELDLYQLLGVERGADASEIRRAYLKAAKRIHPDRVAKLGLEALKEQANEVFAEVTRAHTTLSDPAERQRYNDRLDGHDDAAAQQLAQAEAFYRKGELLLRAGNFRGALELLESAVAVWPDEADYQAALGWTLHRMTPPDNARALAAFEKAVTLGGEKPQILLRMSFVLKELGDAAEAQKLAARARQLDPSVAA